MRATLIHAPKDVRVEEVPDPAVEKATDAVVRVTRTTVCGSDLWAYRGVVSREPGSRIGHEFVGVVEAVGGEVSTVRPGDLVVSPFTWSDGTCGHCRNGVHTSCAAGGFWGSPGSDGAQGEAVRVPHADGTLVTVPSDLPDERLTAVLALSDVMGTGHHAALAGGVRPGSRVAVVGDGAVGLCAVLAAVRLGAEQVIALSRYADKQAIARGFGATDVVPERGDAAVERLRELTGGFGPDAVLECVGTAQSWQTALDAVRPGGTVGFVGVPHEAEPLAVGPLFGRNVGIRGGVAPVRAYLPELLDDVLADRLDPSPVFDRTVTLEGVPEAYAALDARELVKPVVVL